MPTAIIRTWRVLAVGVLLCIGVAIGILIATDPSSTTFVITASVLGSLIASLVVTGIDAVLLDNPAKATRENLSRLESQIATLGIIVPAVRDVQRNDIRTIKSKHEYEDAEWRAILTEARESLLLVGHALSKWCDHVMEAEFCAAIDRLVRDGKEVCLLTLSDNGPRVAQQRDKGYDGRVRATLDVLANLSRELPEDAQQRLHVHKLGDDVELPYMAVANDRILITAPYPAANQSSDPMPTLTVGADSPIAKALREDIHQTIKRHSTVVDLTKYGVRSH
jgi:hypothetical protein